MQPHFDQPHSYIAPTSQLPSADVRLRFYSTDNIQRFPGSTYVRTPNSQSAMSSAPELIRGPSVPIHVQHYPSNIDGNKGQGTFHLNSNMHLPLPIGQRQIPIMPSPVAPPFPFMPMPNAFSSSGDLSTGMPTNVALPVTLNMTQNTVSDHADIDASFVAQFEKHVLAKPNVSNGTSDSRNLTILEAQRVIQTLTNTLDEITVLHDYLTDNMRSSEDQWSSISDKILELQATAKQCQEQLFSSGTFDSLRRKINKGRKKRERIRRKRLVLKKRNFEDMLKRIRRHREIDEWQHKINLKDKADRMVQSLKSEAGETLAEVRKKKQEMEKLKNTLEALQELRNIRRQTSLQRGIFVFEDDDEAFDAKVEKALQIPDKRNKIYDDEETALLVMMEEEREELKRLENEKRKKKLKEEEEREANNPLLPYKIYWLQAEDNIDLLVNVRRAWDMYIVPSNIVGASRIPDGWVSPTQTKDQEWAKYCQVKR